MVSASKYAGGPRWVFGSAAMLALSACGSGNGASNPSPEPGPSAYVYVLSAGSSPHTAGAVYEYYVVGNSIVPMPRPSIVAGIYPAAVVSKGGYVYVVNVGDGTISQYSVASDGTLTALNPATVTNTGMRTFGAAPASATFGGPGSFLYVTNAADNSLSQFSSGSDGQLTPLTPASVATGVNPVTVYQSGVNDNPAYVINSGAPGDTGTVSLYSSGTDGALTLEEAATVPAGVNPSALVLNQLATTAYVVSNCDGSQCAESVRQFTVDASGALTDTHSIVTTGSHDDAVSVVYAQANVVGQDFCTYVFSNATGAAGNSTLSQFAVGDGGQLTPANPPTSAIGAVTVAGVTSDELGAVYVLTADSIDTYYTGAGCAASLYASSTISAPHPVAITVVGLLAP